MLGIYEKMKSRYLISRARNQNDSKDDSGKQISQSSKKSVQFKSNTSTGTSHLSAVTHSGGDMCFILKSNPGLATSTNSVSTIAEETEFQLEADNQTHNLSSDCKAIMNILYPNVDYSSNSESDELTYTDEQLKTIYASKHMVQIIQPLPGSLATFDVKLFSTEPVTALFDTGATCSCISFQLYNQISDNVQMVEMQLQVGQTDSTSLCPIGIVMVNLEINYKQFEHTIILCQNLQQQLMCVRMDFPQNCRIGINWNHNGISYLRHQGRKLILAWLSNLILDSETSHVTDASVTLVTDSLVVRLKMPTVFTIPPHNIVMIPLEPPFGALHCKNGNAKLFEIIRNPLSSV